jgi:hypothetical protein
MAIAFMSPSITSSATLNLKKQPLRYLLLASYERSKTCERMRDGEEMEGKKKEGKK